MRPKTVDDLEEYYVRDHKFVEVDPQYLTLDLKVGTAVLALIAACRESEVFTFSEDGEILVSLPRTAAEKLKALRERQDSWDFAQHLYEQAVACPEEFKTDFRFIADNHANAEGLPAIEWPTEDGLVA